MAALAVLSAHVLTADWYEFYPSYDQQIGESLNNVSFLNSLDGVKRISVCNGHFCDSDENRVKFIGLNLMYECNFPTNDLADKLAETWSKLGINVVRFHHMDYKDIWKEDSPFGEEYYFGIDDHPNSLKLDLLYYFIHAFNKKGIYVNLNLHVSRQYEGLGIYNETFDYGKGLDRYYRPFIDMQKQYAYDLLTSQSQYSGKQLGKDPGVAFIEISNENTIFNVYEKLDQFVGSEFEADLISKWREYLTEKYSNVSELLSRWNNAGVEGNNLFQKNGVEVSIDLQGQNENFYETIDNGYKITLGSDEEYSSTRINYKPVPLTAQTSYTYSFYTKSSVDRVIEVFAQETTESWSYITYRYDSQTLHRNSYSNKKC